MKKQRWFLPTNTENIEIFLSQGVVSCVEGLAAAYVSDIMNDYPLGYIPFFLEGNLSDAAIKSRSDDENLITCMVELDLSQILRMNIFIETSNQAYEEIDVLKISEYKNCTTILLPSPLPLQCIKSVIFETAVIKNEVSQLLESDFGTFPKKFFLGGGSNSKLFANNVLSKGLLSIDKVEGCEESRVLSKQIDYNKIFALGGMLTLMFYQTKNGRVSVSYFEDACVLLKSENLLDREFGLMNNFFIGTPSAKDDYDLLNFKIFNILSENKTSSVGEIRQEIINCLNSDQSHLKWNSALQKIVDRHPDYMSPEGLFSKLMDSYIEKDSGQQKKILMILIMYFFRDNIETMLKFYHEDFKQVDYVLFSMFFGIGSHYIGLPNHIKKIKGLNLYMSNRMAEYGHRGHSVQTFKKIDDPIFIIKNLIKEKVKDNLNYDNFINWYCEFSNISSSELMTWGQSKLKNIETDEKANITHKNVRPVITTKIDIDGLERQMLISTIGNDKDLFDFNAVFDNHASIMK